MKTCLKCGKSYPDEQTFCPDDNTSLVSRDPVQEDPIVGKVLAGRYQITARIARGGMGSVYRAVHTKMNRTCALKLLVQTIPDADSVARFNREAQMASRIDNPHAVTIYDFGEAEDGLLYLAMEYIEGEPLSMTIARERALPLVRVARITSQIAEALSAAHRLGIIHRDLKPDNIMVTRKGGEQDYVKVLDFGIAKVMAEGGSNETLTQTGIVLGTPPYMSPEQLTGEHLDPRSDVYSLALIAYQMICGKLPFSGQTSQTIMMKRLTHDPVKLRENAPFVSESVESVVMTALKRERESRQSSVDQFASELAAALGVSQTATDTGATVPIASVPGSGAEYQGETRGRGTPLAPSQGTEKSRSETEISTVPIVGKGPTSPQNLETDQYLPPSSYVTKRSAQQGLTEDPASSRQTFDDQARPAEPQSGSQQSGSQQSGGQQSGVTAPYWEEQPAPRGSQPNLVSEPGPVGSRQPIEQVAPPTTQQEVKGSTPWQQPYQQSPTGQQLPSSASNLEPGPTRANSQIGAGQRAVPPTAVFPGSQPPGSQPRSSRAPFVGLGIAALLIIGCLGVAGYFAYLRLPGNSSTGTGTSPTPVTSPHSTPTPGGKPTPESTAGGDSAAAAEHYNSGKGHQNQGALLSQGGSKTEALDEYQKSIAEYREAIGLQPDYPQAHENLAVALYDIGDPQSALEEYRIAIDQYTKRDGRPTSQVVTNYGLALYDLGRYDDSAKAFGQALQIEPSDHDLYVHRGFALQNAGRTQEARSDYERYLSLEPAGQYAEGVRQILSGKANPPVRSGNQ